MCLRYFVSSILLLYFEGILCSDKMEYFYSKTQQKNLIDASAKHLCTRCVLLLAWIFPLLKCSNTEETSATRKKKTFLIPQWRHLGRKTRGTKNTQPRLDTIYLVAVSTYSVFVNSLECSEDQHANQSFHSGSLVPPEALNVLHSGTLNTWSSEAIN